MEKENTDQKQILVNQNPSVKQRGSFLPVLGVIIVLLLLVSAYYFGTKNSNVGKTQPITSNQNISPTTTPDKAANWKTFINTKNSFSFRYPNDWQVAGAPNQPDSTLSDIVVLTSPCNYQSGDYCSQLDFTIRPYAQVKLFDPVFIIDRKNGDNVLSNKMAKLDGTDALEEIYFQGNYGNGVGKENGRLQYVMVVEHKPIKIVITYNEGNKDLIIKTPDQWKNKKILDQILSTFKFLDQNQTTIPNNNNYYAINNTKYIIYYPSSYSALFAQGGRYCQKTPTSIPYEGVAAGCIQTEVNSQAMASDEDKSFSSQDFKTLFNLKLQNSKTLSNGAVVKIYTYNTNTNGKGTTALIYENGTPVTGISFTIGAKTDDSTTASYTQAIQSMIDSITVL